MVYILKAERPMGNTKKPGASTQYYVGYCKEGNLESRMNRHRTNPDAAWSRALKKRGIPFRLIAVFPTAERDFERYLKRCGHYERLDPEIRMNGGRNGAR